jgi:hydroxyacylglutathione hydrolase
MELPKNLHAFIWRNPTANNCNSYLINKQKKILIDPGHHHLFGHVREGLSRLSLTPEDMDLVIITHNHPDHMEEAAKIFPASTYIAASAVEMEFLSQIPSHLTRALGMADFKPHILLKEGTLKAGDVDLEVILTPGHSPGSICLHWPEEKVLFSGDVVFNQGIGRTDIPGGDGQKLKDSINRLAQLEVEHLLSGHGEMVSGRDRVVANFEHVQRVWFPYL